MGFRLRTLIVPLLIALPWAALAEKSLEVSAASGYGVAERDGYGLPGVPWVGVAAAWPSTSWRKFQFDYGFAHMRRESGIATPARYNRHFFTGSLVLQPRRGRTRPFLQFGAGIQYETNNLNSLINRSFPSNDFRRVFTGVAGAGLTIGLGRAAFIRPEFRVWAAPGRDRTVNATVLPGVRFGWTF